MTDNMTSNNLPALGALASKINAEHEACRTAMQKGLGHALEAGRLLLLPRHRSKNSGRGCSAIDRRGNHAE